jgi:hypothetical protein
MAKTATIQTRVDPNIKHINVRSYFNVPFTDNAPQRNPF